MVKVRNGTAVPLFDEPGLPRLIVTEVGISTHKRNVSRNGQHMRLGLIEIGQDSSFIAAFENTSGGGLAADR